MHGFEHGVQFPQPQQQYHANPQQQQPYLSLPSGQLTGGMCMHMQDRRKEIFTVDGNNHGCIMEFGVKDYIT